jgi:hypothetical protein
LEAGQLLQIHLHSQSAVGVELDESSVGAHFANCQHPLNAANRPQMTRKLKPKNCRFAPNAEQESNRIHP